MFDELSENEEIAKFIFDQQKISDFFPPRPQDETYLVDNSGNFFTDSNGNYLITKS